MEYLEESNVVCNCNMKQGYLLNNLVDLYECKAKLYEIEAVTCIGVFEKDRKLDMARIYKKSADKIYDLLNDLGYYDNY